MLIFAEVGDLTGLVIMIFLIIGIACFFISLFIVFLYYTLQQRPYTRKEFWLSTALTSVILMVVSGMVCGMMI